MTPTLIPARSTAPLTAADRCDRCGARGTTRVILSGGGELVFCGHHARKFEDTIRSVAAAVVSEDLVGDGAAGDGVVSEA
jgi:hypothetical protein